jgi:hypothetical protein
MLKSRQGAAGALVLGAAGVSGGAGASDLLQPETNTMPTKANNARIEDSFFVRPKLQRMTDAGQALCSGSFSALFALCFTVQRSKLQP